MKKIQTYDEAILNNPIVSNLVQNGVQPQDIVVALANQNQILVDRLMILELLAPRKITLEDGRVLIYRCPENLVPDSPTNSTEHKQ